MSGGGEEGGEEATLFLQLIWGSSCLSLCTIPCAVSETFLETMPALD